jgi:asparagine synthase (glutamine-hydrolysing)
MSMAASLELRPPFLDHELVELAFALPSRLKVRRGTTKWIIKEIAAAHLPTSIVHRRKSGFRVPLDVWFREDLREMAGDLLLSSGSLVGALMDRQTIESLIEEHHRGRRNHAIRLWTLLGLEVWNQVFVSPRSGRPSGTRVTLAAGRPRVGAG